jgi:hypothetical protein
MAPTPTSPAALFDGESIFATSSVGSAPGPTPSIGINYAKINLTSAQILALNTTPIQVINAPGVGFYVNPIAAVINFSGGSIAYVNGGGGAVTFTVGSRTAQTVAEGMITTVTPNRTHQFTPFAAGLDTAANPPTDENAGLFITKGTANYTAGTGVASVVVYFTIEAAV